MKVKSRKLLIVLSSLCAEGTPILTLDMCRWWMKEGIEPFILTLNDNPRDLEREFKCEQIPIVKSINLSGRGYNRYVDMIFEVYKISKEIRPDALLSMPLGWHTFMAYGARLAGVSTVCAHVGNYPPYWTGNAFDKFRLQIQLGRPFTHKLICCSHYVRQGVVQYFKLNKSETVTIYNACNVETFAQLNSPLSEPSSTKIIKIGMVARLEVHKDQPTLIRTAKLLKQKDINCQIQLIG
ncbi:MAG TPA: glycosyltransferase, partial [Candidatus Obscuribacterales bacterium]